MVGRTATNITEKMERFLGNIFANNSWSALTDKDSHLQGLQLIQLSRSIGWPGFYSYFLSYTLFQQSLKASGSDVVERRFDWGFLERFNHGERLVLVLPWLISVNRYFVTWAFDTGPKSAIVLPRCVICLLPLLPGGLFVLEADSPIC